MMLNIITRNNYIEESYRHNYIEELHRHSYAEELYGHNYTEKSSERRYIGGKLNLDTGNEEI
jgi:hypothetical protein